MEWLSQTTLARLRDRLETRGQRPSVVMAHQNLSPDALEFVQVTNQYGTLCEAMYIMMAADGRVTQDERDVLKGALRSLSEDTVRGVHIEAMLDAAAKKAATEGRDARLSAIIDELREDVTLSEVAFVLMAAIAFADDIIEDEENEVLNALAEGLGIATDRANDLLDQVERDQPQD